MKNKVLLAMLSCALIMSAAGVGITAEAAETKSENSAASVDSVKSEVSVEAAKIRESKDTQTFGDFKYSVLNDDTVEISEYTGSDSDVTVPSNIDGKDVTQIGEYAFYYSEIQSIEMTSIKTIEKGAFYGCSLLSSVVMSDTLESIGRSAFEGCELLNSIEIPNSVTSIEEYAFYGCNDITRVSVPAWLVENCSIQEFFTSYDKITEVTILGDVRYIGYGAFAECRGLETFTVPNSVEVIGEYAFQDCYGLKEIIIPDSVKVIDNYAFRYCNNLQEIELPDSVQTIGNGAFQYCNNLSRVDFGYELESIGRSAFEGCELLNSIEIPNSVTSIDAYAFYGCNDITRVSVPAWLVENRSIQEFFTSYDKITEVTILGDVRYIGYGAFAGCRGLETFTVPSSVEVIEEYAFEDCTGLKEIIIPDSVKVIDNYAVRYCNNLQEIELPDSLYRIGNGAFMYCDKLTDIVIPDTVEIIGNSAFEGCEALTSIEIHYSAAEIGDYAFYDSPNVTIFGYKDSTAEEYADNNNIPFKLIDLSNISSLSSSTVTAGDTFKLFGKAKGGTGSYQYAFYWKKSTSVNWNTKSAYGKATFASYNFSTPGSYDVKVNVKDSSGTVKSVIYTVTVNPVELVNKSSLSSSNVTAGKSVTLKGAATGGTGSYTYAFYWKKSSSKTWTLKSAYGKESSVSYNFSTPGTYDVRVDVKDASGNVKTVTYELTVNPAALENKSAISDTDVAAGKSVTLKGAASGGTGSYQYAFYWRKLGNTNWNVKSAYGTASSVSYSFSTPGTYEVKVNVKDASGTVKSLTYSITVTFENKSTISSTEVKAGSEFTAKGAATGKGSYQYAFYWKKSSSSSWNTKSAYGKADSVSYKFSTPGTYDIKISAKDSSGIVQSKIFTITVK